MDELEGLIQQTEGLRDQVDTMHQMLQQLAAQITAHQEQLRARRTDLDQDDDAADQAPTVLLSELRAHPAESGPAAASAEQNRRTIPRRKGHPVPVLIGHPLANGEPVQGWVIDRSPDGLCLVADEAVTVGTLLNVRPMHHFATLSWYQVEVRNCRPERAIWILGCQFTRKLTWSDLRLFS